MKYQTMRTLVPRTVTVLFLVLLGLPSHSQFGGLKIPPIPNIPQLPRGIPNPFPDGGNGAASAIQRAAQKFLRDAIAKQLGVDPPLMLDQSSALPEVSDLDDFTPVKLTRMSDLNRPLPPGDYSVDAMFYCTKYSIHRGGRGVPYKMGRAQGRLVKPMCGLLNRGSLQKMNPASLNAEAWRMQDGLPLGQWPPADQEIVHRLIPEYEDALQGDYLQNIKQKYDSKWSFLTHKSFDQMLGLLGEVGKQILSLEQGRQLLADQSISDDRLPDMLYQQTGEGGNPVLAADGSSSSPWVSVQPGVIARFTNIGGYLRKNLVEFRVTQDARQASTGLVHTAAFGGDDAQPSSPTLANVMGTDGSQSNLIGYPIGQASQDPLLTPILDDEQHDPDDPSGDPGDMDGGEKAGDPFNVANGNVYDAETDYQSAGPNKLTFTRYYNSLGGSKIASQLGPKWRSTFDPYIRIVSSTTVNAIRPDGQVLIFIKQGEGWKDESDARAELTQAGTTWTLTTSDDSVETYRPSPSALAGTIAVTEPSVAILSSVRTRSGYTQTLHYGPVRGAGPFAQLLSVTDSDNRSLRFTYRGDLLSTVATPDGLVVSYTYDSSGVKPVATDRLRAVTYSGSQTAKLSYGYSDAAFPLAVTDVTDEDGHHSAAWTYDQSGRALSSEIGQGAFATTIRYNDVDGSRTVTNALGQQEVHRFQTLQNKPKVVEIDRLATATTAAGAEKFTYDGNGYTAGQTDWDGVRTTYVNDADGQPTSITEAAGTRQERTTRITYQPGLHLPTEIVMVGLTTTLAYDASGNLLTKTLTDTTSTNGSRRTWAYAWANGRLASVRGPRTDVTAVTRYSYDADGVLRATTNALGQMTQITQHTPGGLPLVAVDANGVTTKTAYDSRQRLLSRTVVTSAGPLTTTYAYDPAGNPVEVTQPDGLILKSAYNDAHQVMEVSDTLGQSMAFTLDGLGNRTRSVITDASGGAQRQTAQSFDALGRLLQDTGGVGQKTGYAYDSNGNALTVTDPNHNPTKREFDALGRVIRVTDAAHGVTLTAYDAHDRVISVTAPNGAVTTYTYDGFGDLTEQDSPDTGKTVYRYDANGNLIQRTDAASAVTDYAYDVLDRLKSVTYPADPAENVTYTYDLPDHGFGIGRLCKVTDAAGSLSRTYDECGNVLSETRGHGARTLVTAYRYDGASQVTQITYPSGLAVKYVRDTLGQITDISALKPQTTAWIPIVSNIRYKPFGPISALTYGNGIAETRSFDADYRETALTDTGRAPVQSLTYGYDPASNVLSLSDAVHPENTQTFGYDTLDRLTSATGGYGALGYTYDSIGNRLTESQDAKTTTYTYAPETNRLTSIATVDTTHAVTYTDAGNINTFSPAWGTGATPVAGLTYNQAGRLAVTTGTSGIIARYVYDTFGHRLIKVLPGIPAVATLYQYDESGDLLEEIGSTRLDYINLNGIPIATLTPATGCLSFLHDDRIGTPQVVTDSTQKIIWVANCQPFGEAKADLTTTQKIRFPGQYADHETGFSQNGFRDYTPGLGRYLESDPSGLRGGSNTYEYADDNAIKNIDPPGLFATLYYGPTWKKVASPFVTEPGTFTVLGEGGNGQFEYLDPEGEQLSAADLAWNIYSDPNYISGMPIKIIACNAGTGPNSFAQQVAHELNQLNAEHNRFLSPVYAPNGYVNPVTNEIIPPDEYNWWSQMTGRHTQGQYLLFSW